METFFCRGYTWKMGHLRMSFYFFSKPLNLTISLLHMSIISINYLFLNFVLLFWIDFDFELQIILFFRCLNSWAIWCWGGIHSNSSPCHARTYTHSIWPVAEMYTCSVCQPWRTTHEDVLIGFVSILTVILFYCKIWHDFEFLLFDQI